MKKFLVLHITFLLISYTLHAQVPDSLSTDTTTVDSLREQSTNRDISEVEESEEKKNDFAVIPWLESLPEDGHVIINDSLLRWQIWPNWGDYQAYRSNTISFRQGTNGRIDAFHINGYGPYEQQYRMEGIRLNNPITGLVNYSLVPHRKIGTAVQSYRGDYQSDIRLRDYYIVKPISYLNYDEAGGAFRNLEFMVSQNFTEKTNLEVSYWDKRDGGYYPNSNIEGSQMLARVYHYLKQNWLIRGMYLRNQLQNDEPFGYIVNDPLAFNFSEFGSAPVSSNGLSDYTRWDLVGGIYHRKDSASAEDAGLELNFTNNEKKLQFTGDTLSWKIQTLSSNIFKEIEWQGLSARGQIESAYNTLTNGNVISEDKWLTSRANVSVGYDFLSWLHGYGIGQLDYRSDNSSGFDITGGLKTKFGRKILLNSSISLFNRIPTMQAKYWSSNNYAGNPDLENETGLSINGNIQFRPNSYFTFDVDGRIKQAEKAVFLTPNGSFTNSDSYEMMAGSVSGRFENHLFEIQSSGTIQQFNYTDTDPALSQLNHQDMILWIRNSAFVKGYVFDRAAYLKIGVKTLLSPLYYNARTYNTEIEFWQGNSVHQELPAFFRLDGELSARVRRIMVLIRWENALDGLGQAGYFETAGFPMPPRRLMVGIRAQFRN